MSGPSHNRGSVGSGFGGGSHSSGGFGGGNRSSGHNNSSVYIHRAPIRVNLFGSRIVVSTGRQSGLIALVVLLIFSLFGVFICSAFKGDFNETIDSMKLNIIDYEDFAREKDEAYNMALNGNNSNYYFTTANYVGKQKFYYNGSSPEGYYFDTDQDIRINDIPYFYLIFTYIVPTKDEPLEGETYSMYTSSEASGWDKQILVWKHNGSWKAIEKEYKLSNNIEYKVTKMRLEDAQNSLKTANVVQIVLILLAVGFVVGLALCVIFTIKKGKEEFLKEQQKKDAEIAEANAKAEEADKKAKQIGRVCAYCGSKVPDGEKKCPSCGASKFK